MIRNSSWVSRDNDGFIDFREFLIATHLSVSAVSSICARKPFINVAFACIIYIVYCIQCIIAIPQCEVAAIGNHNQCPTMTSGKTGGSQKPAFPRNSLYFVLIWDKTNKTFTRGQLVGQTVNILFPIWGGIWLNNHLTPGCLSNSIKKMANWKILNSKMKIIQILSF